MTAVEDLIRQDLAAHLKQPVFDVRAIPEGHSGFTYWVDLEGRRAVLRLPPPGARIAGPADIPRQGRIMAALHAQGAPVPAILAMAEQPLITGRPFVLMEAIDGERIELALARAKDPLQLAGAAMEVLRRIQAVRPDQSGIGAEDPVPLTQELARWQWLMQRAPEELTRRAPLLAQRLAESMPEGATAVLVHGDYHYGNMLFRNGQVVAVVDWEIAQLGQPLLDPCCLGVAAQAGESDEHGGPAGRWSVPLDAVRELYGREALDFRWYLALTFYKYAAIFGYNLMLHRRGKRPDPSYERRTDSIVRFIEQGLEELRS